MERKKKRFNLIQRAIFIFGLIVLLGLFGFLIFESIEHHNQPPTLEITIKHHPERKQHSYQLRVENTGEETAKNASVLVNLYHDGEFKESGTLVFDFVPPGSKVEGWVAFTSPPSPKDSLVVSSMTYVIP